MIELSIRPRSMSLEDHEKILKILYQWKKDKEGVSVINYVPEIVVRILFIEKLEDEAINILLSIINYSVPIRATIKWIEIEEKEWNND